MDFSAMMDLVIGEYEVTLFAIDRYATASTKTWSLGKLDVWFKEGTKDTNNQHMSENYFLKKEILAQFPTFIERQVNPVLTFIFVGLILVVFIHYLMIVKSTRANLKKLDFWGFLMIVNMMAIMGVIIAFWVEVNLITTLWILLFLAPFTLFIFSQGLAGSADCEVDRTSRDLFT